MTKPFSFIASAIFIVFLSDLPQYLLLFPDKNLPVIFIFSIVSLVSLLYGICIIKEPMKYNFIKIAIVVLLVLSGLYERIFSVNELSIAFNDAKMVLTELKPKLKVYVEQNNQCPVSIDTLIGLNGEQKSYVYRHYNLETMERGCYLIATIFSNGNLESVQFPDESKMYLFRGSIYWTFILNNLIYSLSSYDDKMITFGAKINK